MKDSKSEKLKFSSEEQLVTELIKFLVHEGYKVRREVSNMGQSVDVVASKWRWHMLVEAKLSNWKRAIEQCQAHKLVGDHVCVAVGLKGISEDLLDTVQQHGIGLIKCTPNSCEWVTTPKQIKEYWKPERKRFLENLKGISHVG